MNAHYMALLKPCTHSERVPNKVCSHRKLATNLICDYWTLAHSSKLKGLGEH